MNNLLIQDIITAIEAHSLYTYKKNGTIVVFKLVKYPMFAPESFCV